MFPSNKQANNLHLLLAALLVLAALAALLVLAALAALLVLAALAALETSATLETSAASEELATSAASEGAEQIEHDKPEDEHHAENHRENSHNDAVGHDIGKRPNGRLFHRRVNLLILSDHRFIRYKLTSFLHFYRFSRISIRSPDPS